MIMKNIQLDDRGRFTYTFDSEVERFTFFIMNTSGDYLDENCTWNADKNLFEMQPLYPYRKNTGEIRFTINSRIIQYLNNLRNQVFRLEFMADARPFARAVRSAGTFTTDDLPVLHDKYEFNLAEGGKYEVLLPEGDESSLNYADDGAGTGITSDSREEVRGTGDISAASAVSSGSDTGDTEEISAGDCEDTELRTAGIEDASEVICPQPENTAGSPAGVKAESGDIRFLKIKVPPDNPEKKSRTGYILKAILWMVFLITVLLVIYCAIIL